MPDDWREELWDQVSPGPDNSFPSKSEQIHDLVNFLVSNYHEITPAPADPGRKSVLGGRDLKTYAEWLEKAHAYFLEASNRDLGLTLASEWILDNYYIIRQALLQIKEDLPYGYYRKLPKLAGGQFKGLPRIYAIGRAVLSFQNHLLNTIDLQSILVQVQEHVSLTMGELWAVPIFLRYILVETLAHELELIIRPTDFPTLPNLTPQRMASVSSTVDGETSGSGTVANIILSLRAITEQNWSDFFESISRLESTLRRDPAGIYPLMDFKTRDMYRSEIDQLSTASQLDENIIAETAYDLARGDMREAPGAEGLPPGGDTSPSPSSTSQHVGDYLLGSSRLLLEQRIGYTPNLKTSLARWAEQHASFLYLGGILLLVILFMGISFLAVDIWGILRSGTSIHSISALLLALFLLIPAFTSSTSLVNWIVTLLVKPRILPKLNFEGEIPTSFRTLVVIPALIISRREIENLVRQLEMNYLRNQESGLRFALLTDFADADQETLPEDDEMLRQASEAIEALNARYGSAEVNCDDPWDDLPVRQADVTLQGQPSLQQPGLAVAQPRFYFLHRKRRWNPSEGKWMGWERKRGKLHELNQLLRGSTSTSFTTTAPGMPGWDDLQCIRYVITLDSDTILPRGAARRLAGTLAHPLNHAIFDDSSNRVVSGYTILQPRMEIHPRSANATWFTRIFAGDTGLDLYTRAVSDAYQDLFGEGSYVGKGIYDVDAFMRSVDEHIPENRVLSHDLLEGSMGRAGLVTDITMIEDYPPNYYVQVKRQQRWIRGDWQLLPWLIRPGKFGVRFNAIDRWKMLDNLLRSLLAPALMAIFFLGVIALPQFTWFWVAVILLSLGVPVLTSMTRLALQTLEGENISSSFYPIRWSFVRWFLALAFLPYEAYNNLDAILTTLYRLLISRRNLLQWTTAAQAARLFGLQAFRTTSWLRMTASTLMGLLIIGSILFVYSLIGNGGSAFTLAVTVPLIMLWVFSPLVDQWISQPIREKTIPLTPDQETLVRQVARRTWGFFERFVSPEDHWLPPDHFQEDPVGIIAHRTSPSNIGLMFTATLAAYDLGYLDQLDLAARLSISMDTLDQMERFRGHFLNWYDTLTLQPLNPRYVSTVDSGNLAACFIITSQACQRMTRERLFRWALWQGYLDTLFNLTDILKGMTKSEYSSQVNAMIGQIERMHSSIIEVREKPDQWYPIFRLTNGQFWPDLSRQLIELVTAGRSAFDLDALRKLQEVAFQVERHHHAVQRTFNELVPWIDLLEKAPAVLQEPPYASWLKTLRGGLPINPRLNQISKYATSGLNLIAGLRSQLAENTPEPNHGDEGDSGAAAWLDQMEKALAQAGEDAAMLIERFQHTAERAEQFVSEMDFRFLFHPQRRVFHNGFNLDTGQLDNNFYDILVSEARIASIVALAMGDVSQSHWLQLSRPMTRVGDRLVLLSWSATMFEYLMPPLFLRSFPGTLLEDSARQAVLHQAAYGKSKGVPWGISESGFYLLDANQNYQYRAFGVPGLGFKRGLRDDLVIAPYASLMAIGYEPQAVAENLATLLEHNSFGLYGLYEAIDFTTSRLPEGSPYVVVKEYMSHHQGMIMMALDNYFNRDIMVRRMHNDPRIQSVELLLQEQIPLSPPLQHPVAEEVKGLVRLAAGAVKIDPWSVPVQSAIPIITLLSNGSYGVLISNRGGGYSTWRGVDLTRWQPDGVLDPWGTWVYIQDMHMPPESQVEEPSTWSAAQQPIPGNIENAQVTYFPHMAVFRRTQGDITSTMEVTVCPDDPVEIRRLHLHNAGSHTHHLRLTSYGEVILTQQAADRRHPAFNKLFIESEFIPELNLQVFCRRPRSSDETPVFMGHMLVVNHQGKSEANQPQAQHEADRLRFIGRGRSIHNPAALESADYLTGTTGATLDPIFSLGQEVRLNPHDHSGLAYLTIAADSHEQLLGLARRYSSWSIIERSFNQANLTVQAWLGRQNYDTHAFHNTLQVLSTLVYPFMSARAEPEIISQNRLGQPGLWRFGVSGDYPLLLIEIEDPKQIELVRQVLQVHEYLRSRQLKVDVVILNHQRTDYGAELNGMLYRLVNRLKSEQWLAKRGGIFILYADQITPQEHILLQTAASFVFKGERGSLAEHITDLTFQVPRLPDLVPTRPLDDPAVLVEDVPLPPVGELQFFNGYGGFSPDGREYVIDLPPSKFTPAPWINVIGYPYFGFMVSETGSQTTWAINSGENRLTPWSNDPVSNPSGEVLYLRDEETGEVWTPTPLPAGDGQPYRLRHGAGYTIFEHHSHGLRQQVTLFASPTDPVKVIHLRVENTRSHNRRLTATQYIEWVLGTTHAASVQYIQPEYDAAEYCLLATNPYNPEFAERAAFLIANKPLHGLTTDRVEFLGRGGTFAFPEGLRRIGLESRHTPGEDLCGALQLHIDLLPGGVEEVYFVFGQGDSKEHALELARKYHDEVNVEAALEQTHAFWDYLLGTIQVRTPEKATDLLLNRWMLYQSLSCRVWGRSAFYQPSGAFGFRDQLQDILSVLPIDPDIARRQILNAAQFQFTQGDVLHWWHPPLGRGVRTRISDDLLWLPYAVAHYIETTGDMGILDEKVPFLDAPPLRQDEVERYNLYTHTEETFTLLEHCIRAIRKAATHGQHGLPLIGSGDWNDALNRVGEEGRGESVWLAWFLCDVLERFARLLEDRGDAATAELYRTWCRDYSQAVEAAAWDGAWYRRAYYDDGFPLGSSENSECQIDAIAQSWSIISRAGSHERSRQAMQSVLARLVKPDQRLSLLFTPPLDQTEHDPGYIKGYHPGIRENGGQYSHAAIWTAWAFAMLGDGQQAGALFDLLNPIFQADTQEKADEYRVEPYVISADVYSQPPYVRRGGWTWYTGSAGWMYRLGVEALLGFKKSGTDLRIDPTIPPGWESFELDYRFGTGVYHVRVLNPGHVSHGVQSVSLDGSVLPNQLIPLCDDGQEHAVEVSLGIV